MAGSLKYAKRIASRLQPRDDLAEDQSSAPPPAGAEPHVPAASWAVLDMSVPRCQLGRESLPIVICEGTVPRVPCRCVIHPTQHTSARRQRLAPWSIYLLSYDKYFMI
jgi:hypothetical protein